MTRARLHPYVAGVLATIRARDLAGPDDAVLVAASGGPDSTALLAALAALRDAGHLRAVLAVHVDHQLRPGGEDDAACVRANAGRLGVPFDAVKVSVGAGNLQAAARARRYAALRAAALRCGADRIATGHTRDDQAETVVLRLLRGAGARGLAGIPPRRGAIIRPLIDRRREEGLAFLREERLGFREDPTNASARFLRNRVRAELMPVLARLAPAAVEALARAADLARDDERALAARARRVAARGGGCGVALRALARAPVAVQRRVVRHLFGVAGGDRRLGAAHVEAVRALGLRGSGARTLPGRLEARVEGDRLVIGPRALATLLQPFTPVVIPGPGRFATARGVVQVEVGDAAAVPWPLVLRTRLPGDRFAPPGGTKKLKAWLIDRKVGRAERDRLLVLAAGADVLAIPALGAVARGLGPAGARLVVRLREEAVEG